MATTASSKGRVLGMGEWTDDDLIQHVEWPTPSASLPVNDWFWGIGAPDPVVIPWTWLVMPLELRVDQPLNSVQVTGKSSVVASATNSASQGTYGTFAASATLTTVSPDDAASFASWLVQYFGTPTLRSPTLTLPLEVRTTAERWRILGCEIGTRIVLGPGVVQDFPGHTTTIPVPAGLPVRSFVIEGVHHSSSAVAGRVVTWATAQLLGARALVTDSFNRVVAAGSWGAAETGQTYNLALVPADYSVGSNPTFGAWGNIQPSILSDEDFAIIDTLSTDHHILMDTANDSSPASGQLRPGAAARVTPDFNNYYLAEAFIDTTLTVTLRLGKRVNGNFTVIASLLTSITHAPIPQTKRIRFQVFGSQLQAKLWLAGTDEPAGWMLTATDTDLPTGTQAGIFVRNDTANTGHVFGFDNLLITNGQTPGVAPGSWFRMGISFMGGPYDAMPF